MTKTKDKKTTIAVLALVRYGEVTPRMMEALLRHYGTIEMILASDAGTLMAIGRMTTDTANKIAQASDFLEDAETYYQLLLDKKIHIITRFDSDYPHNLFELHDPPPLLFYRGIIPDSTVKIVSVVGTQTASNEGIELTTTIAKKLATENIQILSGLHTGINISSHLGAKSSSGKTFAVLESGLENIFPEENRPIAVDIAQTGGLITEFTEEIEFSTEYFLSANRLLAAISQAVIITEFYKDDSFVYDLLEVCSQIGKMAFILIDPKYTLVDTESLNHAVKCGAIPMVGLDKLDDIIHSLV